MFRVSPETAASAASLNARTKQTRSQPSDSDGFSALVDSNAPNNSRDAAPATDAQPQRLDGGDTPSKADNRPDTRTDSQADGSGKRTLKSSKADSKAAPKDGTQTGVKTNSKTVSKAGAKTEISAATAVSADTTDLQTATDITTTATLPDQTAQAVTGDVKLTADATAAIAQVVGVSKDGAGSTTDDKSKDSNSTDAAAPEVAVVADATAIVAVIVPVVAVPNGQTAAIKPATDDAISGIKPATIQAPATTAAAADFVSATDGVQTKADAKTDTSATALNTAVQNDAPATASDATTLAAKVTAPTTNAEAATAVQASAQTVVTDEAIPADTTDAPVDFAKPASTVKPKAAPIATATEKTALTDSDAKTDAVQTSSFTGQTAETAKPHGTEHAKADTDKVSAQPDKADATPSDTKPATAHAAAAPAPADHRAPAVRSTDINLPPVQTQQTQPLQNPQPNLTVTPAQINTTLANTPVPVSGLAVDIALKAAGGSSRFDIRLDPAELGRIDVRLDVDKHGNVTSHLTVEKPATLDMLRQDAPKLQQALEDAGLKTGDSGLQFSLRDQSSGRNDNNDGSGRNSHRLIVSEDDTVPAQIAGQTYGRGLASSSGVDIRV
ncbi:MAG: flagellar hook-length control protein FliK [Afipia sp.]|nr:flagellar hook-length control protein FliK [Afipia sp.]